jgi:glycosyltransferase involved in cell wall biosynthesis
MARAIAGCGGLNSSACRAAARARFSERRMIAEYLALYERLARRAATPDRIMAGRR